MMELYIGGVHQGKYAYVKEKYGEVRTIDERNYQEVVQSKLEEKTVVFNHLHLIVRKELESNKTEEEIREWIQEMLGSFSSVCMISDEVGNGVVPVEKEERRYREVVGSILIELAKKATRVERIICGIPMVIKK